MGEGVSVRLELTWFEFLADAKGESTWAFFSVYTGVGLESCQQVNIRHGVRFSTTDALTIYLPFR